VYELEEKVFEDATAEMHDQQIAKFEVADAIEIGFRVNGNPVTLRKDGTDWKCLEDRFVPIDGQKVTESLNTLRDLKTHRFVAYAAEDLGKYGLSGDSADMAKVVLEDGERIEVLISSKGPEGDEDESRYARQAGSSKVFLLKGEQVEKLQKQLDDFEKES
jgi:hypothetical protein